MRRVADHPSQEGDHFAVYKTTVRSQHIRATRFIRGARLCAGVANWKSTREAPKQDRLMLMQETL